MHFLKRAAAALLLASAGAANAQGIPVIDIANLVQSIMQVINDVTKIQNQVEQIEQLRSQVNAITGSRNLGTILNSAGLNNYVPADAFSFLDSVGSSGYSGLTSTGKALRDAGMIYNCLDQPGSARAGCQAALGLPYQHKGLLQDAMRSASGRLAQINGLMARINSTSDQKAALEIQARIGAENALLAHEMTQIQMLQGLADSEERIARSRDRERQYEMLGRTGRIADKLP